jgi:hypothetical protein
VFDCLKSKSKLFFGAVSDAAGDIVDHYCLRFDRGVVHIVVAVLLLPITISDFTKEWFKLLWLVILLTITL